MVSSTSMPIASAMPPSDMMFSDRPAPYITLKVATTEIGIAMATIAVVHALRRNRYRIRIASRPPSIAA